MVIFVLGTAAGFTPGNTAVSNTIAEPEPLLVSAAPERCPDAHLAVLHYRHRYIYHRARRDVETERPVGRDPRSCPDARRLARVWLRRAARQLVVTSRWIAWFGLRDFQNRPGSHAWEHAVREVQRPYLQTYGWLMSCSATEGGHGRWVPNSDGGSPGGWMQFKPGTFWRMFFAARTDVTGRGFRVPESAASWYSPLGQALAGAWAATNGATHEWSGSGC